MCAEFFISSALTPDNQCPKTPHFGLLRDEQLGRMKYLDYLD